MRRKLLFVRFLSLSRFYVHPLCLLKKNLGLLSVPGLTKPMTPPGRLVRKLSMALMVI